MSTAKHHVNQRSGVRHGVWTATAHWAVLGILVGVILPCPPESSAWAQGIAGGLVVGASGAAMGWLGVRHRHAWLGAGIGLLVAVAWGWTQQAGMGRVECGLGLLAGAIAGSSAEGAVAGALSLLRLAAQRVGGVLPMTTR